MEFDTQQNLLSALVQGLLLSIDLARLEPGIEEVFAPLLLRHEEEILQDGHALQCPGDLKCTDNLARKNAMGRESINALALEPYMPSIRRVEPGNHVKQRRFSSPIGTNQPGNRAASNAQRAAIHS